MLELQARLERSERENLRLRDRVRRLKLLCRTNDDSQSASSSNNETASDLLSPQTYEYSQSSLVRILEQMGIPHEAIQTVSVQIELEYQRWEKELGLRVRDNKCSDVLSASLSYCFDFLLRSFLQNDNEYYSPLFSFLPQDTLLSDPPFFSDGFKDFVDLLCQPRYAAFYDEIKRFCIDTWIVQYNRVSNPGGKSVCEMQRDFCNAMEKKIRVECGHDVTCEVENEDIKKGMEQLLTNVLGGGAMMNMIRENSQYGEILNKHVLVLQFLLPEHLDVKKGACSVFS